MQDSPHYIAVAKPPFTICQDELANPTSLSNHLRVAFPALFEPKDHPFHAPKGVHRLDALVTGCVLYGTSVYGTRQLAKSFRQRKVKKGYLALLTKSLSTQISPIDVADSGTITSPDRSTEWHVLARLRTKTASGRIIYICWLSPLEGKNHQLRIHAAEELHAPIIFDRRYSFSQPSKLDSVSDVYGQDAAEGIALHCASMHFPLGLEQKVVQCLPPDFGIWKIIAEEYDIDWQHVVKAGSDYKYHSRSES